MNKKILIVDDDPDILDSLSLFLELEGFLTRTTPKGDDTLKIAKIYNPDLILLDLLLSGKDGSHICRELKANVKLQKIPVMIMSAHPSATRHALNAGADDFIAKPFELDELIAMIGKYIK